MKITKYILQLVVILHCIVMSLSVYAQTDRYNSKNFTKGVADSLSIKNTSIHVGEKVLMHNEGVSKVTGTPSVLLYMQQSPDFPKPGLCHVQDFLYLWTKV